MAEAKRIIEFTKGGTAGGWIHISNGKTPVALVNPKYVDKIVATPDMYQALKTVLTCLESIIPSDLVAKSAKTTAAKVIIKALAKADGKEV